MVNIRVIGNYSLIKEILKICPGSTVRKSDDDEDTALFYITVSDAVVRDFIYRNSSTLKKVNSFTHIK